MKNKLNINSNFEFEVKILNMNKKIVCTSFFVLFQMMFLVCNATSEYTDTKSDLDLKVVKLKNTLVEYEARFPNDKNNTCFSTYHYIFENWNQSDVALNFLVKSKTNFIYYSHIKNNVAFSISY